MRRPAQIALVLMGGGMVGTAVLSPALFGCDTVPGQPDVCVTSSSTSTSYGSSIGRSSASGSGVVRSASADGGGTTSVARGGFGASGSAHSSGG